MKLRESAMLPNAVRLAHLEATHDSLKSELRDLASNISKLSDQVASIGKPNWSILIAGAAFSFTLVTAAVSVAGAFGALSLANVNQRITALIERHTSDVETADRLLNRLIDRLDTLEATVEQRHTRSEPTPLRPR